MKKTNFESIEDSVFQFKKERKISSILVAILLLLGLALQVPLWQKNNKIAEVVFCYKKLCKEKNYKSGIKYLVNYERHNSVFNSNVKLLKTVESDNPYAAYFGFFGAFVSGFSWFLFKAVTEKQKNILFKALSQIEAEVADIEALKQIHNELVLFSNTKKKEITEFTIEQEAIATINELKPEEQLQFEYLQATKQAEIDAKEHLLVLADIENQLILKRLAIEENNKKLAKLRNNKTKEGESLKSVLIEALKNHEDGWLWALLNNLTPIWLIGRQGSAKTYTACAIALLRKYLLDMPVHTLVDEHLEGANWGVWQYLQAENQVSDTNHMPIAFSKILKRWSDRIAGQEKVPEQFIIDEYTQLKDSVENADELYRRHLKDTRKANVYFIGVTHNDTNSAYPERTKDQRENSTILIRKYSANGKTPMSRVTIARGLFDAQGNEQIDAERTIPDWMHPDKIHGHFNGTPIVLS